MTDVNTAPSPKKEIILVTDAAVVQMQKLLADNPDLGGIRVGVIGGGCAGLQYNMEPAEKAIDGDVLQETGGVTFFIHPMAVPYLKGTTIDFSSSMMDGGFKFINPNATSSCGCGTSFGV